MELQAQEKPQRLGDFILENMESLLATWEDYARRFWQGQLPDSKRLRNDAEMMIRAVVADMATSQTSREQKDKSEGKTEAGESHDINLAAMRHAIARVQDGFDIGRMVAEFRALRASVDRIWGESMPTPHPEQIQDIGRFHEALDQLVAASLAAFTGRVERSRRLFLGILGHDLRTPLYTMQMFIEILTKAEHPADQNARILASMGNCCQSMKILLNDLLDFTTTQLGSAMPVSPAPADLAEICRDILVEMRALSPDRRFTLDIKGDLHGEWDEARLRQVICNLISNAIQHGTKGEDIATRLEGRENEVTVAVHNAGKPIPEDRMGILFDPMVRVGEEDATRPHGSIGLGLYICEKVATAHGGDIHVDSSGEEGTTFTVRLPRRNVSNRKE